MRTIRCMLIIIFFVSAGTFPAAESRASVTGMVKKADKMVDEKEYDSAIDMYDKALEKRPDDPVILYNRASALYHKGKFDESKDDFLKSISTGSESIESKAVYNAGNSIYRSGEFLEKKDKEAALKKYTEAAQYFKRSMELAPDDMDAKFNYEFTLEKIKNIQNKSDNQNNQDQKDQQDKDNQKDQDQKDQQDKDNQENQDQNDQSQQGEDESQGGAGGQSPDQSPDYDGQDEPQPDQMSKEDTEMLLKTQEEEENRVRAELKKAKRGYQRRVVRDW
ncbi:MAG: tetratricopeptide repeat protein [Candidatus Omnitrophota bacterium]